MAITAQELNEIKTSHPAHYIRDKDLLYEFVCNNLDDLSCLLKIIVDSKSK